MGNFVNIVKICRFENLTGVWLLAIPCWWGLLLNIKTIGVAGALYHGIIFLLGAFFLRSAGCIINDMADAKYDALVARCKDRPLASGKMSFVMAFMVLVTMLMFGL